MTSVLRYTAFASTPDGGNPAGIVLDAGSLDDTRMQEIAADVGFAETAFLVDPAIAGNTRHARVRYFSPIAEVPFCGHATVATAVALARRDGAGTVTFETPVGPISIETTHDGDEITAAFTSVEPEVAAIDDGVLDTLLGLLDIGRDDLDPRFPPRVSFAGNRHPVLVFASRSRFDSFAFDPAAMRALMDEQGWAGTVTTLFAVSSHEFEARNLFPVGVITEDPATGSAAASVGGYLRALGLAPERVLINQGAHVGRPSLLTVDIPPTGGIVVSGTAVEIA
ncbi:PhzF family phenazine biosynthesis isomerase [Conyzicola nivalis]|uniref:Oxidoreductase n=1 Tax=Conyzicola nivalis TaxID=1477021 RepID=A0A916SIB5_9MICO|nr:PhzF family phenazine biosynthesis protein [Conyzicola nivalis]GGB01823.1 oxidoreductase [Conyzicola nivalis]